MKQVVQVADKPTLDKVLEILESGSLIPPSDGADKHTAWLLHYEMMGKNSFVFNNKDFLHELYEDYQLSMNNTNINIEAFNYIVEKNTEVGVAISKIYGIDKVDVLETLSTLDDVLNNSEAMKAISKNEIAMNLMNTNGKIV